MNTAPFDLQPMSTGDILDRSVRLYRRHFLHNLAIVCLPYFLIIPVWAVLGAGLGSRGRFVPFQSPALVTGLSFFFLAYLWFYFVSMGALARSVSERFLGGTPTVWGAYSPVLRRSLSLIWAYLLPSAAASAVLGLGAGIFVGAIVVFQQHATTVGYGVAAVMGIGAIVAIAFAVQIFFRSFLITQVLVIEDIRGVAAFKRSWKLMRAGGRKAGLILVFGFVVAFVISLLVNFPAGMMMALIPGWTSLVVSKVLESIGQILSAPFVMIAFTLLYYDSRIRLEAFDLEMMAQNLGVSEDPVSPSESPTRPHPPPPLRPAPAAAQARPARPPRSFAAFKLCPSCGAQVPNIQPSCVKCGTRVPYRAASR